MTREPPPDRSEPPPSRAAQWFARMRDDRRTPADEAGFNRWLGEDPVNERAYQRLESMWGSLELARNAPQLQAARAQALAESQRIATQPARWSRVMSWFVGAAAVTALVAIVTSQLLLEDRVYQTAVGDRKTIQLADGSELTLNTDSMARVHYELWARKIDLERGQAHFKVAHSRLRPFLVDAGQGVIRAVGTEFDVYRHEDQVRVTLVEGRIEVSERITTSAGEGAPAPHEARARMVAGQQISMSARGLSAVRPADMRQATAWLEGRLIFDGERLQDAVREINRYSTARLLVLDPQLAQLRVSGVFRTDRADSFLKAVETSLPVKAIPAADGATLIAPSAAGAPVSGPAPAARSETQPD